MNLVRAPGLLHKMFLTSREMSKYVIIVRMLFLSSEIQNDRSYHLWQYHEGESNKTSSHKIPRYAYRNNKHGFKSEAEISAGNPWDQSRLNTRAGADSWLPRRWELWQGRKVALSFITTGHTSHRFAFKFTHLYSLGIPNQLNSIRRVPISFYHRGIC